RRVFHRQEEGPGTSRGKRRQRLAGEAFVRLVVQEKGGLSVRELPAQLRRGKARVERQRHGTQAHQGAEGYHVLGAVLREQRHVAAGADAGAPEATGGGFRRLVQLAKAPRARAVDERRLFGREVRPPAHPLGQERAAPLGRRARRAVCLLYHTKLAAKSSPKRRWSTPVPLSAGISSRPVWVRTMRTSRSARGRVSHGSQKRPESQPAPRIPAGIR